jgi:DNA-binding response OmpR family regulator
VTSKILIIEDDQSVRDALADALSFAGVLVELAADGQEGMRRLEAGGPPAAILLDLRGPHLGGEEFLLELRADARYAAVPVITMDGEEPPVRGGPSRQRSFDPADLLDIVLSICESQKS